jgi:hypothetical protein
MEELRARLEAIKEDMKQVDRITDLARRESNILELFDRVNKEVI